MSHIYFYRGRYDYRMAGYLQFKKEAPKKLMLGSGTPTTTLTLSTCQWIQRINSQIIELFNKASSQGNTTYAGTGAPPSSTGTLGDIYLQLDSGQVHQKDSDTTWSLLGEMSVIGGTF